MRAFHTTLGRRGISANHVNIEFVKRPSELRVGWSFDGSRLGLVAVEREWLTEAPQNLQCRFETCERLTRYRRISRPSVDWWRRTP